jgi:hypothetical protein
MPGFFFVPRLRMNLRIGESAGNGEAAMTATHVRLLCGDSAHPRTRALRALASADATLANLTSAGVLSSASFVTRKNTGARP